MRLTGFTGLTGLAATLALALASCEKPATTQNTEPTPPPAATPAPATPSPATPTPAITMATPPPATPVPATPAPELAPEGVFYLIAATRVETPDGIRGLPPGTGVKLVRPGIYLTPAGEVPLDSVLLTNDLAKARAARAAAQAAQAAITQRLTTEAAAAAVAAKAKSVENGASNAAAMKTIEKDKLQARITALRQQQAALDEQVAALQKQKAKESFNQTYKNRTVTSSTDQRIANAAAQAESLIDQIRDAENQLRSMARD